MVAITELVSARENFDELASDLRITISPETPTLGAVVTGVNGKEPLSPEAVALLTEAILRYKVLFFRNQFLTDEEHHRFTLHFGDPCANKTIFEKDYDAEGLSNVTVVPHFHADLMYLEEGPSFSMLQMHTKPPVGGDTMWADLVASYHELSPTMQGFLEGLTAINGRSTYYLSDAALHEHHLQRYHEDLSSEQLSLLREFLAPNENPLVRVIPENGERVYWISEEHTQRIKELSDAESSSLLKMLFAHQMQPRFIYRYRWNVGDIAFWDHRTTLHSGIADFGDTKRHAKRQSVGSNRPISVAHWNRTHH
jgi:taurine dioxygenase